MECSPTRCPVTAPPYKAVCSRGTGGSGSAAPEPRAGTGRANSSLLHRGLKARSTVSVFNLGGIDFGFQRKDVWSPGVLTYINHRILTFFQNS